jgi:hypothetical protein
VEQVLWILIIGPFIMPTMPSIATDLLAVNDTHRGPGSALTEGLSLTAGPLADTSCHVAVATSQTSLRQMM